MNETIERKPHRRPGALPGLAESRPLIEACGGPMPRQQLSR
ncbi:hypothetical protein [Variovorax guangxiensis]|nr:hypothetical protein [Variovorax guangxiensis]